MVLAGCGMHLASGRRNNVDQLLWPRYYLYAIIGVNALYLLCRVVLSWTSMGKWNLRLGGFPELLLQDGRLHRGLYSSHISYLSIYVVDIYIYNCMYTCT